MSHGFHFPFKGLVVICLLGIFGVCLFVGSYVYANMKKMEQNVVNLTAELQTTSQNMVKSNEGKKVELDSYAKLSLATKDWVEYDNDEFDFSLKRPLTWNNLIFQAEKRDVDESGGKVQYSTFAGMADVRFVVMTYDYNPGADESMLADETVKDALLTSNSGECSDDLMQKIMTTSGRTINNCFVRENLARQKFILFSFSKLLPDSILEHDSLVAVYPRDNYFIMVTLPATITEEVDYFLQNILFL